MLSRRLIARAVGRIIHVIGDLFNIAACNGLDLRRELPWDVKAGLVKANIISDTTPSVDDPVVVEGGAATRPLSPQDFLFLMDVLSAWKESA
ncbi:MAG: hypothetical protein ACRD68_15885, partial [Pyrinomonadaceae bacterium]